MRLSLARPPGSASLALGLRLRVEVNLAVNASADGVSVQTAEGYFTVVSLAT
jgi:hypothetical protein